MTLAKRKSDHAIYVFSASAAIGGDIAESPASRVLRVLSACAYSHNAASGTAVSGTVPLEPAVRRPDVKPQKRCVDDLVVSLLRARVCAFSRAYGVHMDRALALLLYELQSFLPI